MNTSSTMNYSDLSHRLTKELSTKDKRQQGIYFSPPQTIQTLLTLLTPYWKDIHTILEPSCGSCEFITQIESIIKTQQLKARITGIEKNSTIFQNIELKKSEITTLHNEDFLQYDGLVEKSFDLIIGNPPFFVCKKKDIDKQYYPYFSGRPNIFILFIIRALELLAPNGILAFILPSSFMNCQYYEKTRRYIKKNFTILSITEGTDDYLETKQKTIIVIIQKKQSEPTINYPFFYQLGTQLICGPPSTIQQLKELTKDSTTLDKLQYKVSVGTVVWNQCKDILTKDETKTRLIYSSDIKDNTLSKPTFKNLQKKHHIDKPGITDSVLVLTRGYGVGKFSLNYCLLEKQPQEYLIENHLTCIQPKVTKDETEKMKDYKKIIESLENPKTAQFIQLYCSNQALNCTELQTVLPIYIDKKCLPHQSDSANESESL
tara:strand:+ start:886 stop:2181 length:1296 start_codon:yes stop_codon:yes gene_type:complete